MEANWLSGVPGQLDVVKVSRASKTALIGIVERNARVTGRAWAVGGPRSWSKDELVHAVICILRGEDY